MKNLCILVGCLTAWAVSQSAHANVLFSQLPVDGAQAFESDDVFPPDGAQSADSFVLDAPQGAWVTGIRWWGTYDDDSFTEDEFSAFFYNDAGGSPPSPPIPLFASPAANLTRTATGLTSLGATVYEYTADLTSPLLLDGGTTYYLSMFNETGGKTVATGWYWMGDGSGGHWQRPGSSTLWAPRPGDPSLAFQLTGSAIPEPGSLATLGVGLVCLAGYVRYRRKRSSQPKKA
jgi:hypothetical protein